MEQDSVSIILDTLKIVDTIYIQPKEVPESSTFFDSKVLLGLLTPILVTIGGMIAWLLKAKREELKEVEEKARERRLETYNILLEPFIEILRGNKTKKEEEKAIQKIVSIEYKKAAFNLMTFGSDEMVNSFNQMMQFFYDTEREKSHTETLGVFGNFLLAIRKDLYNKNTKLDKWDMLRFLITDLDKFVPKKQ